MRQDRPRLPDTSTRMPGEGRGGGSRLMVTRRDTTVGRGRGKPETRVENETLPSSASALQKGSMHHANRDKG